MLSCKDVANYFLAKADPEIGDTISNLKLQKLVYYAQGFYLAIFDQLLFPEEIKAWAHGPVVPELYQAFKQFGSDGIPCPDSVDFSIYDGETAELLDEVWAEYGQYAAWKLRDLTHNEPPWRNTARNGTITEAKLTAYFKTQIN